MALIRSKMRSVECSIASAMRRAQGRSELREHHVDGVGIEETCEFVQALGDAPSSARSGAISQVSGIPLASSQSVMRSSRRDCWVVSCRAPTRCRGAGHFPRHRFCRPAFVEAQAAQAELLVPVDPSSSISPDAARCAADAGLLSSCARFAASLPRAVSFSACCSMRVTSRTRSSRTETIRWLKEGIASSISGKSERSIPAPRYPQS